MRAPARSLLIAAFLLAASPAPAALSRVRRSCAAASPSSSPAPRAGRRLPAWSPGTGGASSPTSPSSPARRTHAPRRARRGRRAGVARLPLARPVRARLDRAAVLRVAALPWVERLAPVEVVVALNHEAEVDQSRARPRMSGRRPGGAWRDGRGRADRGTRHRLRPAAPDLDDLDFRRWSTRSTRPRSSTHGTSTAAAASRSAPSTGTATERTSPASRPAPARALRSPTTTAGMPG